MKGRKNLARTVLEIVLVMALAIGQQACSIDAGGLECDNPSCMPLPEQSSPNSYTCSCTCTSDSVDYEMAVKAGADDAEQNVTTGTVSLTGGTLDMPLAGATNQLVGVRFADLNIPQGAHIVSAKMQFTSASDAAGAVSVSIVGEANDNAAAFASTAKNLSSRQFTASSVAWSPLDWKKDGQGPNQQTPPLETIVQEIVSRPGWAPGNAIVLMIKKVSGTGTRSAYSFEGKPLNAPVLVLQYDDPAALTIGPQDMPVCMPPALNANLPGGTEPQQAQLQDDCQYRVGKTFVGMAEACNYPTHCGCVAVENTKAYAAKCDDPCAADPVAADCSNFDPVHHKVEATNAPGDDPVCEANCPLSFNMFGRRSECLVEGTAHVGIGGEQADPSVTGIVQFRGDACPEGDCAVGMEYNLAIDDVRFETLFDSEAFEELKGIGESTPGQDAVLSRRGDGTFAPGDLLTSGRGRRGREQQAFTTFNRDPIDFNVKFGSAPTCSIHGTMVGGSDPESRHCQGLSTRPCTDDSQCAGDTSCPGGCKCVADEGSTLELGIDLAGTIVNQPPTADAGKDQIVQCPARVALDGSASSDLDGNIAAYTWLRGGRAGNRAGSGKVSEVKQLPGTETYVLRVIDARGQSDEDSTEVTVVDTMKPEVRCGVRVPVLTQTNHTMADVGLSGAAHDACEGDLPVRVDVFSDESDDARVGDGNLSPDGQNIAVGSLKLRQERQGKGNGRVYLIRTEATDSSGNLGVDCCTVVVPQALSRASLLSVQQQASSARSFCLAHEGAVPAGFFAVKDAARPGPKR